MNNTNIAEFHIVFNNENCNVNADYDDWKDEFDDDNYNDITKIIKRSKRKKLKKTTGITFLPIS